MDLVDVGDEPALSRRVDLLVVGPQLALDGEEQHFQVPFLREPGEGGQVLVRVKGRKGHRDSAFHDELTCVVFLLIKTIHVVRKGGTSQRIKRM